MQILYVHGAGASEQSFHWLQEQLPMPSRFFSYPVDDPITWSLRRLEKRINIGNPIILLGHSLGGVLAAACANLPNVQKLITINAPFGGVQFAALLKLFTSDGLIRDLHYNSPLLTMVRSLTIGKPHLAIVGTNGLPFFAESNDGAITVVSQTAIPNVTYKLLPLNHFEVLLSSKVADLIKTFINDPATVQA